MSRWCCISVASVICVLAGAPAATAQAIGGTVTDETGGVLPGVTVEVRSPALIEQVRTAVSDGSGTFLIISLESGTYTVTFTLPGFSTFVRDGVELIGSGTATVDGEMQVGALDETITVSGAAPLVDVQGVAQQSVMTREVIDSIPTGKAFNNFGVLVPGMTTGTTYGVGQDVGGQSGQSHQRMAIHGGSESDQRIMVDGMSMSPWTQEDASLVWFSDGNFEEVEVNHSVISAESELGGVQFNMIPRSGGNTFSSRNFLNFSAQSLQRDNLTDELVAAGLPEANRLKTLWSVNPSVGGPIAQDKLWFFAAYTHQVADSYVAFYDDVDSNAGFYTASDVQAFDDQWVHDASIRLTWQATDKDKIQFYFDKNTNGHPHFLIGSALSVNVMPSSSVDLGGDNETYQATWTSAISNRILLEAGVGTLIGAQDFLPQSDVDLTLAGILEVGSGLSASRGLAGWFSSRRDWLIREYNTNARASLSYVTGSHSAKFGTTLQWGNSDRTQGGLAGHSRQLNYFGNPIQALFSTYPLVVEDTWDSNYMRSFGLYAQDQWTLNRLSVNAGVRFDYFRGGYPDQVLPDTVWSQGTSIPGQDVATWKDLSPRLGLVYDVMGNGKTAIKVTANRYVDGLGTTFAGGINPALSNTTISRTWYDGGLGTSGLCYSPSGQLDFGYLFGGANSYGCIPGDGVVQGDPRIANPNGELIAPGGNPAFGNPTITEFFDPDWAYGWGKRFANWEFSGGVQQELTAGVSANVSVFRRVYVNYEAQNNRSQNAADFDPYCVTVPTNSALANSGQELCGLYEVSPAKYGVLADELTTFADNFGSRTRHWIGVDLTMNARMDNGLLLQGGVSTGRTTEDQCELNANLNNPSQLFCATETPFLTQVKLLGSYTLPGDIQIAGTFQSLPGFPIAANVVYTGAELSAGLGRTSNESNRTIQVIEPGTLYSKRLNQFDLRVTKTLNLGTGQYRLMFDLYNMFNDSTPLELNNQYGSTSGGGTGWQSPVLIIPGTLAKFAFQIDF
jgi:hypothetical protein